MDVTEPEIVRELLDPPRAEFELIVPEQLYYLQGHFPDRPVLPGVIQIHWAIQLARRTLSTNGVFKGFEALKFHQIIEPLLRLKLTLERSEKTGKLIFSYVSDAGVHSQGRILFE